MPAPNGSGVAIANGVVYFQSLDGTFYALNAKAPDAAHALLASFATGGNYSGPGAVHLGKTGLRKEVVPAKKDRRIRTAQPWVGSAAPATPCRSRPLPVSPRADALHRTDDFRR
jgi:hypothetical protein